MKDNSVVTLHLDGSANLTAKAHIARRRFGSFVTCANGKGKAAVKC